MTNSRLQIRWSCDRYENFQNYITELDWMPIHGIQTETSKVKMLFVLR